MIRKNEETITFKFVVIAYVISWAFFMPFIVGYFFQGYRQLSEIPGAEFFLLLGSFGPFLAAIILTFKQSGISGLKKLLLKLVDWKKKLRYYLVALFTIPISLIGILFFMNFIILIELSPTMIPLLLINLFFNTIFGILPLTFVIGPFGEELGWRGYLLPNLLKKHHPIKASLILGFIWATWHLPLFLYKDWTLGLPGYLYFPIYLCAASLFSITYTWLHLKVNGSVLIAMIMHYSINYTLSNYLNLLNGTVEPMVEAAIILIAMAVPSVYCGLRLRSYIKTTQLGV